MHDFAINVLTGHGPALYSTGQAGFIIKSSTGRLLAIDLYLSECVERIEGNRGFKRLLPHILEPGELDYDVVICTHPHMDHFDIDSVPEMMGGETRLFCSEGCEELIHQLHMEHYDDDITYVKPGDNHTASDFSIYFVECDHGTGAPDAVGVIVKADGKTIYEVGDSCLRLDRVDEIKSIAGEIDVLICPINGMYGNMDSKDAVDLSMALKPKVTIPCHYGMFAAHGCNIKEYYDLAIERKLPVLIMRQGEMYKL